MNTYYDPLTHRTLNKRPPAFIIDEVFEPSVFLKLQDELLLLQETQIIPYTSSLGRFGFSTLDYSDSLLNKYHEILIEKARSLFSSTLLPTYCLWSSYRGFRAQLPSHVDDNACTYTIDLCVSYKTQWPIYVEEQEILLEPNQAVCYYGEDQYHWREKFPDPANNEVQMLFFHFVEPEHWFFTKGPSHIEEVARKRYEYQKMKGISNK